MSPAGAQQSPHEQLFEHVTCLGCGCTCDDIAVRVVDGRIADAQHACTLGVQWFGDGRVSGNIQVDGRDTTLDAALAALAALLQPARRPLVYVAPDLSCEAQRQAVALADLLHGSLDTVTGAAALGPILAAQERGRAGATLGEIRNRADVLVFWGVDPDVRYPRYWTRYAPAPSGLQVPDGRRSRTVIAVDVGGAAGPRDADLRIEVSPADEIALLTAVTAVVQVPGSSFDEPLGARAAALAARLVAGRYTVIVADGEPPVSSNNDSRPQALVALAQALNGPTRAALSTLRGGGNRPGADAVLTAQTGYPAKVSFRRGFPSYEPRDDAAADAAVIVGDAAQVPARVMESLNAIPLAVIGPGASTHRGARVAIDTGVAGIHVGGTAMRLDDVPLPLRPSVPGPGDPAEVIRMLIDTVRERGAGRAAADPRPGGLAPAGDGPR